MLGFTLCLMLSSRYHGLAQPTPEPYFTPSDELHQFVNDLIDRTVQAYPAIPRDQLAVTLVDLNGEKPVAGQYRGNVRIYPASVVKIFFEARAYQRIEDEELVQTDELMRGLAAMIRDSDNDATSYIVDAISDTTSGPELSPKELRAFGEMRQSVTRYFESLGYRNINLAQKPWSFGPYGREIQHLRAQGRNGLTTEAVARLIFEIASGKFISPEASRKLLGLMKRDLTAPMSTYDENQTFGFIGRALPRDSLLWSKAGWTGRARHDAAKVILPAGQEYILVIFTGEGPGSAQAARRDAIRFMSGQVVRFMQGKDAKTKPVAPAPVRPNAGLANFNDPSGQILGGPDKYWSPEATCSGHTFRATTTTSFPDDPLNYAIIPAPPEVEGRRVRVSVWVPACNGDAWTGYYISTQGRDYGPYWINQDDFADEFVTVNRDPVPLNQDSYLYLIDGSRGSGVIALSDVRFEVVPANAEVQAPETPQTAEPSGKTKKSARVDLGVE
jgi:hypothetical protein